MNKFFLHSFVAVFALASFMTSMAGATITGVFNNGGTIADPFTPGDIYDIWEFVVTSDNGDISTLDFTTATGGGFSTTGTFGQFSQTFSDSTAFPTGGPSSFPDTFFVINPAPPTVSGLVVDSSNALEAFYSNGLTPAVPINTPTTVAIFTILQGSVSPGTAPAFAGGFADVGGVLETIELATTGGIAPTAIFANAPYSVGDDTAVLGDILPLTLDATPSTGDGPLTFEWDLNGTGDFDVNTGSDSTLLIADAIGQFGFGIDLPIGVRVTNSEGFSIATTTVSVIPEPASLVLTSLGLICMMATRRRRAA